MWTVRRQLLLPGLFALIAVPAGAEAPLSAIDWLSQSVATPIALPLPQVGLTEPPVTKGALPEDISVQRIDGPSDDAVGLLPGSVTGLPRDLWGPSPSELLVGLIRADTGDSLPALRGLLYTLLLAELAPPVDSDARGLLFLARVDRLLDFGALDQARALLDQVGADQPETFRRWFDVALLLGEEDRACATMRALPDVAPTYPARIFCLARGGDWTAAALTLQSARALGDISPEEEALLSRFLDPELFEGEPALPTPARPSPLVWRMLEAVGEPMATNALPLAFAHGDLRPTTGWKAQIEAAERLTRTGALPPNRLLGLYDARKAAASGGVWDRVAAVQAFDAAFVATDNAAVAATLPRVWDQMAGIGLQVAFAELYGEGLAKLPLTGAAADLAFRIGLLSPAYEAVALAAPDAGTDPSGAAAFLAAVARGDPGKATPPEGIGTAIRDGFAGRDLPPALAALIAERRLGEAILRASAMIAGGAGGDLGRISDGLACLRAVGLEDVARRTSLQLLLLDQRG